MARQVAGVPPGQGQTSGVARLEFCANSQKIEYQCQAGLAGCEPPPINHDAYDDNYIRSILNGVKCIAMVGASPVNIRPSYFAFKYLAQRGYDMIPVNPGHVGKSLLGKPFVASLLDIRRTVDMVDIFRNSSHIMPAVEEALRMVPLPKVIWMQLGARDDAAAEKARGCWPQGRDEPLSEDRIRKALLGNFLDGSEFAHAELQARAAADTRRAAAFSRPYECQRRSDRSVRSRHQEQERPRLT